jgi:hypothetical protein
VFFVRPAATAQSRKEWRCELRGCFWLYTGSSVPLAVLLRRTRCSCAAWQPLLRSCIKIDAVGTVDWFPSLVWLLLRGLGLDRALGLDVVLGGL